MERNEMRNLKQIFFSNSGSQSFISVFTAGIFATFATNFNQNNDIME